MDSSIRDLPLTLALLCSQGYRIVLRPIPGQIRLGAHVKEILITKNRVVGIRLQRGEVLRSQHLPLGIDERNLSSDLACHYPTFSRY